jgi:hypothetical protein
MVNLKIALQGLVMNYGLKAKRVFLCLIGKNFDAFGMSIYQSCVHTTNLETRVQKASFKKKE